MMRRYQADEYLNVYLGSVRRESKSQMPGYLRVVDAPGPDAKNMPWLFPRVRDQDRNESVYYVQFVAHEPCTVMALSNLLKREKNTRCHLTAKKLWYFYHAPEPNTQIIQRPLANQRGAMAPSHINKVPWLMDRGSSARPNALLWLYWSQIRSYLHDT